MANPSDFTVGESPIATHVERYYLLGAFFGIFAYGIHVTLYIICMSSFYSSRKSNLKASWFYMTYITINFILGSIGNVTNTLLADQAFVDEPNRFPGGPSAFVAKIDTLLVTQISFIVYTINTWSQDGLLLYRFYVIFGETLATIVLPCCLYLVSISFSCLLIRQLTNPGDLARAQETLHFGLVFWSISIGTTVFLTTMIVMRLVILRIRMKKVLNQEDNESSFLSVSAALMESAFLYSFIGAFYLVFYAKGNLTQYLFLPTLGQVTSISPLLITWRVAQRRAWTSRTLQMTSSKGDLAVFRVEEAAELGMSENTSNTVTNTTTSASHATMKYV